VLLTTGDRRQERGSSDKEGGALLVGGEWGAGGVGKRDGALAGDGGQQSAEVP